MKKYNHFRNDSKVIRNDNKFHNSVLLCKMKLSCLNCIEPSGVFINVSDPGC